MPSALLLRVLNIISYKFLACECLTRFGAVNNNCRREDGQCPCKSAFAGRQCDQCAAGYYEFPYCRGICNTILVIVNTHHSNWKNLENAMLPVL